jgi:hypothetical protein
MNRPNLLLRALAAAFALSWLVLPGFGLIDLAFAWAPDWPQVLEAGWGAFFTFLVGAPFVLIAVRPTSLRTAGVPITVAAAALAISAFLADELGLLALAAAIALEVAAVGLLGRALLDRPLELRASMRLLLLALAGTVPGLVYSIRMYGLNREGRFDADITIGIDHYAVQGALGVAIIASAMVAALWPEGRRAIGTAAGASAAYLGLVSLAWPGAAGGVEAPWSAAAIVWGASAGILSWMPRERRTNR